MDAERGSPRTDEVAVCTAPMPTSALREGPPLPDPPPASSSLLFDVLLPSSDGKRLLTQSLLASGKSQLSRRRLIEDEVTAG